MKKLYITLVVLFLSTSLYAQRERINRDQLEAAKIAFITTRLDLTSEQAEKFWPIFNEFNNLKNQSLKEIARLSNDIDQNSEEEAMAKLMKRLEIQGELIQQERAFIDKASSVLSYNQILKLNRINRDFTRQLYQRQRRPDGHK